MCSSHALSAYFSIKFGPFEDGKMTKRQLIACSLGLATVIILAGIIAWTSVKGYQKEAEINSQIAIEQAEIEREADIAQTKIEQDAKLERTRERMNLIPWYKGGENKEDEE
jgi:hypothetical protein